jgi:hypothetical protein
MGLHQHLHPDELQRLLLLVCVFDMIFFSYYLFTYEIKEQNTISDSLFSRVEYAITLSITLTIRMLGVALYLARYRNSREVCWIIQGFTGISLTLLGW